MFNSDDEGVLGNLDSSNQSTDGSGAVEEGSVNSDSPGIDAKAFTDLASAVTGMQSMMGKWSSEMGSMRDQISQNSNQGQSDEVNASPQSNDTWNRLMDDPDAFMEQKFNNLQQKRYDTNQKQVSDTRAALVQQAPDYMDKEDAIVDMIAKDNNIDPQVVRDQYATIGTGALFNAYKRITADSKISELTKLVDAMKQSGGNIDDAKRALARTSGSGDSFDPPSRTDVPSIKPRDMSREQRKSMLSKMGITKI